MSNAEHSFGGNWTLVKLDVLERYLAFYNTALQHKPTEHRPFRRIYIDAFAGTGECSVTINGKKIVAAGSARRALETNPSFHHCYFIDIKAKHIKALMELVDAQGETTRTTVIKSDANEAIIKIIEINSWASSRAVMFLDPYAMSVKWSTLEKISRTQAIDVWYLFPLNAVCRQLAHKFDRVDVEKSKLLNEIFGCDNWREALYQPAQQSDLFSDDLERDIGIESIVTYGKQRLAELFPLVLEPIILRNSKNGPLFALFFLAANPSPIAQALSKRCAAHLIKMVQHGSIGLTTSQLPTPIDENIEELPLFLDIQKNI